MADIVSLEPLRARITRLAHEAGVLPRDPLAPLMEAVAELPDEIDRRIERRIAPAVTAIEAARQPARDDDLRRAVVQGVSVHGRALTRALEWRTALIGTAIVLAALLIGAGGGYWQGRRTGYADGAALGLQANAVIAAMPTAEGLAWEQVIRDNPAIANSLAECRKRAQPQNGRSACELPIWIEPPPPNH